MTKRRRKNTKTAKREIRTPQTMEKSIQEAMLVIDSDEAATMIEGQAEAGVFSLAVADVYRLMYTSLVADRRIRDHAANREHFAKGQLLTANLLQNAYAAGMRAGLAMADKE